MWSHDQKADVWQLARVEATQEREHEGDLVTLKLEVGDGKHEVVTCTGGHPFWVVSGEALDKRPIVADLPAEQSQITSTGRWTEARWLRLGDRFLTRTGYSATVVGLTIRLERVKVYNLQVNRLQLYAVGQAGVLVHNSTPGGRPYGPHGLDQARNRKIPGWVIDDTIDNYPGKPGRKGRSVHYSPDNNTRAYPETH